MCIGCKPEDEEMVKEFIFKVTSGGDLGEFEVISLNDVDGIELISANHLELKSDIINSLVDKTIPKPEVKEEVPVKKAKKKNGFLKFLLFLLDRKSVV